MRSILGTISVILALSSSMPMLAQTPPRAPQTYGTTAVSYVEIPAFGFLPTDSTYGYSTGIGSLGRYSTFCGGLCFGAPLRLPSGARIVYLELDFVDTDPSNAVYGVLVVCDYTGQNCTDHPAAGAGPADCLFPGEICSGGAFSSGGGFVSADLTPDAITVDNFTSSYGLLGGGTNSSATLLSGMIVGYVLQVSPATGPPTFNDVQPSNPQFQFVEALVAAGITAGCGGGNYCPTNPVTRGQMAVFLAKALGLQWP